METYPSLYPHIFAPCIPLCECYFLPAQTIVILRCQLHLRGNTRTLIGLFLGHYMGNVRVVLPVHLTLSV